MSLAAFTLARPQAVEEAVKLLAEGGADALIVAGGTDLVPNLRAGLFSPKVLVDIKGLRDLSYIKYDAGKGMEIGALTTLTELAESPLVREHYPVLAEAAATVASPVLRNMGTLGGNICLETRCVWYNQSFFWRKSVGFCLKKDGNVCHVAPGGKRCWAVWSGDTAGALLALDAEIEIVGPGGARRLPLADFYKGDGMDRVHLQKNEILTRVFLPAATAGFKGTYRKLRMRNSIDYPLAGVAVAMKVEGGICRDARVGLVAASPAPLLAPGIAEKLNGQKYQPELVAEVERIIARTAKPLTTNISTPEYRREMLQVNARRALVQLWTGNGAH
jgi:4-hydroxybenzoyl-CoA reductase subunit beta